MKYILYTIFISLLVISTGVQAVDGDIGANGAITNSFGQGGTITDVPTFGGGVNSSLGGGNGLNTTVGGGNGLNTTGGGGNGLNTTVGGGNGLNTTGGSAGSGVRGPSIPKPTLSIEGLAGWVVSIMNYLVWAMITAALLVFLYGVFTLMFVGGANEESRSKGRKFMFWGIVSLFVMVSVWGLVNILKTSVFGGGGLQGPQFKTNR